MGVGLFTGGSRFGPKSVSPGRSSLSLWPAVATA